MLLVHISDSQTSVTVFTPCSSSFRCSFSASVSKVCYDPGHLTPMCPLLAQNSLSQLAIIHFKNTHKLITEITLSNSYGGRCNRFGRFRGCNRGNSFPPDRNTKMSQTQEHPAPNLKQYSRKANGRVVWITLLVQKQYVTHHRLCLLYHYNHNLLVTGKSSNQLRPSKELHFTAGRSAEIHKQRAQRQYKHCKPSRITFVPNDGH